MEKGPKGTLDIDMVVYSSINALSRALDVDFIRTNGWVGGAQLRRVRLQMGSTWQTVEGPLVDPTRLAADIGDVQAGLTPITLDFPSINPKNDGR